VQPQAAAGQSSESADPSAVIEDYVKARGRVIIQALGDGGWRGRKSRVRARCENGQERVVTGDQLLQKNSWCQIVASK
jgi:hypothetical protein